MSPMKLPYQGTMKWMSSAGGIQKTNHVEPDNNALSISEKDYHVLADATLDEIVDRLSILEEADSLDEDDVDITCSQGVLNIILGQPGTWVINKQTPNRQLWWSSPKSGPRRYDLEYDEAAGDTIENLEEGDLLELIKRWKCSNKQSGQSENKERGENLFDSLRGELLEATGIDILEE